MEYDQRLTSVHIVTYFHTLLLVMSCLVISWGQVSYFISWLWQYNCSMQYITMLKTPLLSFQLLFYWGKKWCQNCNSCFITPFLYPILFVFYVWLVMVYIVLV